MTINYVAEVTPILSNYLDWCKQQVQPFSFYWMAYNFYADCYQVVTAGIVATIGRNEFDNCADHSARHAYVEQVIAEVKARYA